MRKLLLIVALVLFQVAAFACPVCEKNQPKLLKGISHGTGPQNNLDYVIVWTTVLLVILTLFYTIKWLIKPGEKEESHIKRMVIK